MVNNVVVITGPTASGKSGLGVALAQRLNGEIVNADSVQIYKDFNIGSGKPDIAMSQEVPHHLFSSLDPREEINAGKFSKMAREQIAEISEKEKLPIVVGGTGLYVQALLSGILEIDDIPENIEEEVDNHQRKLEEEFPEPGDAICKMHTWLSQIDALSAERISKTDLPRIRRALLVKLATGKSLAELQDEHQLGKEKETPYRALVICLFPDRDTLYELIDRRVEQMLDAGLVLEVQELLGKYQEQCQPFRSIGYKHVRNFLSGECASEEMMESMKKDTRRFAKRQYTWWRHQPEKLGWTCKADHILELNSVNGSSLFDKLLLTVNEFLGYDPTFPKEGIVFLPLNELSLRN
jgi:tRNA dimethylallyltransferase